MRGINGAIVLTVMPGSFVLMIIASEAASIGFCCAQRNIDELILGSHDYSLSDSSLATAFPTFL